MTMPVVKDDVVIFQGGLDLTTPNLKLKPGHVRSAQNWQCVTNEEGGGYERTGGYERYNGGTAPSSATYTTFAFSSWIHTPAQWTYATIPPTWPNAINYPPSWEYAWVIGLTSGAIGKLVFYVDETIPAHYVDTKYIVVTLIGGVFQAGETIGIAGADIAGNVGGVVAHIGVWSGATVASISAKNNAIFLALAADMVRAYGGFTFVGLSSEAIGPVLGVFSLVAGGVRTVYAFRNRADGLAAHLYKAVAYNNNYLGSLLNRGQWQSVFLRHEIRFTAGGVVPPSDGALLTRGSVTAIIKRVVHESGSWDSNTAAGRFIIESATGTFSAGSATIGATITVTLAGPQTLITLQPNGKYQFHAHNFGGQLASKKIYGADGVNRAFEFDGDVFVPIETKAAQDTPKFVRVHQNHLILALGSSIIGSGPGVPYRINAPAGGFELATGDEVTGLQVQPGNQETAALAVFGRNSSGVLYGTSADNFNYKTFSSMTGSIPYMQDTLDQTYLLDDQGVLSFAAAQEYGNFRQATLTPNISEFLTQRKNAAVGCCVNRERSQFRLFFSDGSALYLTIVNGRLVGAMPQQFTHVFSCVWSAEDENGNEETFAGGTDGKVYQLDRGSSHNGEPIVHHMIFTQNYMGAPRIKKQFRNAQLEIQSNFYAEFELGYTLSYGSLKMFQPLPVPVVSAFQNAPPWDTFVWDNFFWDGVTLSPSEVELKGKSEAIQMIISGSSTYVYPFRLSSLLTPYSYTRRTR